MNRIEKKFRELKRNKKKAFIAFITAGYPSLGVSEKLICEFSRQGVDIIELGVPFSDPLADGPVIQEASQEALKRKTNLYNILNLVKRVRKCVDTPICLMTYYNPIFCFKEERFIREAKKSGVDGVIIPDLPPEEGRNFIKTSQKYGLDVICFVAPTTSVKRIRYIAGIARGFIYYVSLTGVTGARKELPRGLRQQVKTIKRFTSKPVCVGFGVSNPLQVKQVCEISDGAIIGSAIVKKIKENIYRKDLSTRVGKFVAYLARGRDAL